MVKEIYRKFNNLNSKQLESLSIISLALLVFVFVLRGLLIINTNQLLGLVFIPGIALLTFWPRYWEVNDKTKRRERLQEKLSEKNDKEVVFFSLYNDYRNSLDYNESIELVLAIFRKANFCFYAKLMDEYVKLKILDKRGKFIEELEVTLKFFERNFEVKE